MIQILTFRDHMPFKMIKLSEYPFIGDKILIDGVSFEVLTKVHHFIYEPYPWVAVEKINVPPVSWGHVKG